MSVNWADSKQSQADGEEHHAVDNGEVALVQGGRGVGGLRLADVAGAGAGRQSPLRLV